MPCIRSLRPALATVVLLIAPSLLAAVVENSHAPQPSYIVVGFVGGFVRDNNPYHGPVQLAQRMKGNVQGAYIRVFENRHRRAAYQTILRLLDTNHDGVLSNEEKARARIILFGHSWGASAAVLLARDLDHLQIPVLLTVQVDSVAKPWQHDRIIPDNVAEAINFYQPHGIIHGRSEIFAANPAKTQILGNYRFDYKQTPVRCEGYSWLDYTFTAGHMQSECDPKLWGRIEALVRQRIQPDLKAEDKVVDLGQSKIVDLRATSSKQPGSN